jgi:pilus assembly protein CpaB
MEKGKRAVAIPVKANTMAGGFVSPGDYVDVIVTYRVRGSKNSPETKMLVNEIASETILKNVKVLAVDQESSRDEDAAKVAKTVTLEVDSAGAEKVALAAEMGEMILSLRGLGDEDNMDTSDYTTDVGTSKILQNMALIENGGTSGAVKIYNGATLVEQRPRGALIVPEQQGGTTNNNNTNNGSSEETSQSTEGGAGEGDVTQ